MVDSSGVVGRVLFVSYRSCQRTDVGSRSEQPDGGDRLKAAFSDALKRAAVKFGIAAISIGCRPKGLTRR
jgi:hypothetical protein